MFLLYVGYAGDVMDLPLWPCLAITQMRFYHSWIRCPWPCSCSSLSRKVGRAVGGKIFYVFTLHIPHSSRRGRQFSS